MSGILFARGGRMFGAALASFFLLRNPPALFGPPQRSVTPRIVLWAWERPEDLRFLAGREAGVAFLASTVRLSGDAVEVVKRRQPLRVDPSTPLVAVVRVESSRGVRPSLSRSQREAVVAAARASSWLPGVRGVQLDTDAARSERGFVRGVLTDLRKTLRDDQTLSVTALASWCLGDRWLEGLPVDEAVPMFFEMGVDGSAARARSAPAHLSPVCRESIGLSTAEESLPTSGRRLYLFSREPWTKEALDEALRRGGFR